MISNLLVMTVFAQAAKPTLTLILVAGNEHPITDPKAVTDKSSDRVTVAIQDVVNELEKSQKPWVVIDGDTIATPKRSNEHTKLFTVSCHYSSFVSATQDVTTKGKTKRAYEETTSQKSLDGTSVSLSLGEGHSMFFTNIADGPNKNNLMLTNLSALPRIEREKQKEYVEYLRNSIAVSHQSVWDTEDWLSSYRGEHRPTIVLCASGRPQNGHRDLLAFPPEGVILTYQVTFDKRWSAELQDIIRVR